MSKPEFVIHEDRELSAEALDARFGDLDPFQRLSAIRAEFPEAVFVTGFSLADQAVTHMIASEHRALPIAKNDVGDDLASLVEITVERYDLQFEDPANLPAGFHVRVVSELPEGAVPSRHGYLAMDETSGTLWINPLADWDEDRVIDHVLAHEVPVNPFDMPGYVKRAA